WAVGSVRWGVRGEVGDPGRGEPDGLGGGGGQALGRRERGEEDRGEEDGERQRSLHGGPPSVGGEQRESRGGRHVLAILRPSRKAVKNAITLKTSATGETGDASKPVLPEPAPERRRRDGPNAPGVCRGDASSVLEGRSTGAQPLARRVLPHHGRSSQGRHPPAHHAPGRERPPAGPPRGTPAPCPPPRRPSASPATSSPANYRTRFSPPCSRPPPSPAPNRSLRTCTPPSRRRVRRRSIGCCARSAAAPAS